MGVFGMDAVNNEDAELLALLHEVQKGGQSAFANLLARYDGLLHRRVAAFRSSLQDQEDAYQEACLALHRAAMRYQAQDGVTFGLYAKICIDNALKTKCKQDGRSGGNAAERRIDFVPFEEGRFFASFLDPVVEEEKAEELLSLIQTELSPYERQVFDLYIQKISTSEIAELLGRDEKSIQNAIGRMLVKLRKRLGR
jgi:RNA polymerase sigma factor (sigma-70 family)